MKFHTTESLFDGDDNEAWRAKTEALKMKGVWKSKNLTSDPDAAAGPARRGQPPQFETAWQKGWRADGRVVLATDDKNAHEREWDKLSPKDKHAAVNGPVVQPPQSTGQQQQMIYGSNISVIVATNDL